MSQLYDLSKTFAVLPDCLLCSAPLCMISLLFFQFTCFIQMDGLFKTQQVHLLFGAISSQLFFSLLKKQQCFSFYFPFLILKYQQYIFLMPFMSSASSTLFLFFFYFISCFYFLTLQNETKKWFDSFLSSKMCLVHKGEEVSFYLVSYLE